MKQTLTCVFSLILAVALAAPAFAQTDGTLATQTSTNWSTAPWTNLVGPGAYPTGGGQATLNAVTNTILGTVPGTTTLTLDAPITVSRVTYNAPFTYTIAASGPNTLDLATTGATFDVARSILNTSTLFALTNTISAPISGGGTFGLTKTGAGTLSLSGVNTYNGGTHINGGTLVITGSAGDQTLGQTSATVVSFDGGSLLVNTTGGWATGRDISLGAGGGNLLLNVATTINGTIFGPGALNRSNFAQTLTLTAGNIYTGATNFQTTGATTLSGNGSIATSSAYDLSGTLNLDNAATNVNNRLGNTAPIASRGATITLTGNAAAPTAETVGATTLKGGLTTLILTPNTAQAARLNFASITREGRSTLLVRGTSLGATPGANVATITSAVAPTLVGGGGGAGATNISILPWAVGRTNTTSTGGFGFVTYDATNGFRPLESSEYRTDFFGGSTDNVLIGDTASGATTTVNSLIFAPFFNNSSLTSGTITIASGAFLYSPPASAVGTVTTRLNFGSAEGIVTATATLTLGGGLFGTGGVTFNSYGIASPINVTATTSTYTGTTTLVGGDIQYSGLVANDGSSGPFGQSTSPIVFQPGSTFTRLAATAASTINRGLTVQNSGVGSVTLGTTGTTYTVTVNGAIDLQRRLTLGGGSTAAGAIILHGAITGAGGLTDSGSSFNLLDNAGNTFSGGVNVQTGTYAAGADGAFGTGLLEFSGSGKIQSADATAHTLGNDILLGSSAAPIFQGTGSLTFTGALDLNGSHAISVTTIDPAKITFSGLVSNGAITKTGTGTLNLARPAGNTYTGGTVLGASAGTLEVNNSTGTGTGTGTVSIGTGSSLIGSFTISGATSVAGTLSPGTGGIGAANFGGNLTLGSTATTNIQLASAGSFDTINVGGTLTLDGTIVVTTTGGYVPVRLTSFHIVGWSVIDSGGFNPGTDFDFTGAGGSANWDTSAFLTTGTITAIPEPAEDGIAIAAVLGGVALLRWRARAA